MSTTSTAIPPVAAVNYAAALAWAAIISQVATLFILKYRNKKIWIILAFFGAWIIGEAIIFDPALVGLSVETLEFNYAILLSSIIGFVSLPPVTAKAAQVLIRNKPFEISSIINVYSNQLKNRDAQLSDHIMLSDEIARLCQKKIPFEVHNKSDRELTIWSVRIEAFPDYISNTSLTSFVIEQNSPLPVEAKRSIIIWIDVLGLLKSQVTNSKGEVKFRLVLGHSWGLTRTEIFSLASFREFAQNLSSRRSGES